MRWDKLFDDLLAQLDREQAAEFADERRDTVRAAVGNVSQSELLRELSQRVDGVVVIGTPACKLSVTIDSVGADWVAVTETHGGTTRGAGTHVIPTAAISTLALVTGSSLSSVIRRDPCTEAKPRLIDRVRFDVVLRDLARRRRWVDIVTLEGALAGTLDAVGRDWCEVARHSRDVPRRQSAIEGSVVIAFSSILSVRVD